MSERGQQGQAAVEVVLVLPLIAALALGLLQVGLVARDQLRVVHAAREGARTAAVVDDGRLVREAAIEGSSLEPERTEVRVRRGAPGQPVTVQIRYRAATDLPLVGRFVGDLSLSATTSMRVER